MSRHATHRHRSLTLVALLAVMGLLVAACGNDDETATGDTTTTTSTTVADDDNGDGDDDPTMITTPTGDDDEDPFGDDREGEPVDASEVQAAVEPTVTIPRAQFTYRLAIDAGSLGSQEITLAGPIDFEDLRADLTGDIDELTDAVSLRVIGDRAWLGGELPELRQAMPDGARWAEGDTEQLNETGVLTDPWGTFDAIYLLNGAENVHHLGTDDRDGDSVEVYRFDLDYDAAVEAAPADRREGVSELITFSGENEPTLVGLVAIDDEDRVRQLWIVAFLEPTEDEAQSMGAEPMRLDVELNIADIGEHFDVEEPPADEVVQLDDHPELMTMLAS